MSICKLCLKESELRKSHIIPEFAYRSLYSSSDKYSKNGRFFRIPMDREVVRGDVEQKGYREPLLCQRCESLFSRWENELRDFFSCIQKREGNKRISIETLCDLGKRKLHKFSGFNYSYIKLGLLSILWRLSLSNIEHFSHYHIGQKHEERLRVILDTTDRISEAAYWIAVATGTMDDDAHRGFQSFHQPTRMLGQRFQRFTICATTVYVRLASVSDKLPDELRMLGLKEDGTVLVLETDLADAIQKNHKAIGRLQKSDVISMYSKIY